MLVKYFVLTRKCKKVCFRNSRLYTEYKCTVVLILFGVKFKSHRSLMMSPTAHTSISLDPFLLGIGLLTLIV